MRRSDHHHHHHHQHYRHQDQQHDDGGDQRVMMWGGQSSRYIGQSNHTRASQVHHVITLPAKHHDDYKRSMQTRKQLSAWKQSSPTPCNNTSSKTSLWWLQKKHADMKTAIDIIVVKPRLHYHVITLPAKHHDDHKGFKRKMQTTNALKKTS